MPFASPAAGPAHAGEPHLRLRLEFEGGRIGRAALLPSGLPDLAPLLVGRPVEEAAARLARLLAACPAAHAVALCAAAEAAVAMPASPARRAARDVLVLTERARALALRRAVAWPALFGEPVRVALAKALLAAADELARAVGLGQPRAALAPDRARLPDVCGALEAALAALDRDHVGELLLAEAAALGGTLGRVVAGSLAERLAADRQLTRRIRARLPLLAGEPALPPLAGSGRGRAALATDRGRLVWSVELQRGRLAALAGLTPTERALRSGHPVLHALRGARPALPPARVAALAMAAIDPCWPWRLELATAARPGPRAARRPLPEPAPEPAPELAHA